MLTRSRTITSHERKYPRSDRPDTSDSVLLGDPERESGPQQAHGHEWVTHKEKASSAESIDRVNGRNGKEPIHGPSTERYQESVVSTETRFLEDRCGIICNDIYLWIVSLKQRDEKYE